MTRFELRFGHAETPPGESMTQILLVGVYASAIPAIKDRTANLTRSPVEWSEAPTAPEGWALVRDKPAYDIVVIGDQTPGFQSAAEEFVRSLKESARSARLIAVGQTLRDCKPLVLAGCENWCSLAELPDLLRSFVLTGAHVAT